MTNLMSSSEFVKSFPSSADPIESTIRPNEAVRKREYSLLEADSLREVRIRTLSHWPHVIPYAESMANAGWFSCNISDRVICIYCNTICHQWTEADDPIKVHTELAPQCPFVLSLRDIKTPLKIVNTSLNQLFEPLHPNMANIIHRQETFANPMWTNTSPSIDDFVRAGFFFSGVVNTVTCFYCNGSLHTWGTDDNPLVEHARWFPTCIYARQACGEQLYQRILMAKKGLLTESKLTQDELDRLVAARMDLPIVQRLSSQYQLGIIKRCFKEQLRMKNDDFASDLDLVMACYIVQAQIDNIQGFKDRIIVPSKHRRSENSIQESNELRGECLVCLTEEKQVACIPCGHMCACVPCGYALKSCPVCREKINCFLRINT
ncbi:unnamed protein product [Adineta ricciae]|uniref:RING-type domain-containing protein n=1 Tax=Adineta ricciae TaxID=249248 RepID=A0A815PSQ6_ADIRI|nr:unnamed protein product [Adineta ricciae]